jgi:hypothetical protein
LIFCLTKSPSEEIQRGSFIASFAAEIKSSLPVKREYVLVPGGIDH